MQCVANEKPFTHYYPAGYRYSLEYGVDNVIELEDWDISGKNLLMKESPRRNEKRRDIKFRTPHKDRSNAINRDLRKARYDHLTGNQKVGLYRNLRRESNDDSQRNEYKKEQGATNRSTTKSRKPNKVPEEPLIWSVNLN